MADGTPGIFSPLFWKDATERTVRAGAVAAVAAVAQHPVLDAVGATPITVTLGRVATVTILQMVLALLLALATAGVGGIGTASVVPSLAPADPPVSGDPPIPPPNG